MRHRAFTVFLLACGAIGPLLFVATLLIEGATRPGYSAWRNYVSQLSLSDQGWMQITNFIVCGLLVFLFAIGLRESLGPGKGIRAGPILLAAFGIGLVITGIFVTGPALGYPSGTQGIRPQTPIGIIHSYAGLFDFVCLAACCFVIARRFVGDSRWRGWTAYSVITGVLVLLSFAASALLSALDEKGVLPNAPTGLLQRVAIILGWGWIAILSLRMLRARSSQTR